MKKIMVDIRKLGRLLTFDFRGTSINKELEKLFYENILPILKTDEKLITPILESLNCNPLFLYILIKEISMSKDLLIDVTETFFREIQYRQGVDSHVSKLLGDFITESSFVSELHKHLERLQEVLVKKEFNELLFNLFTLKTGNAAAYIVPTIFWDKKFFDIDMLIDLGLKLKNYISPSTLDLRQIIFKKIEDSILEINENVLQKNKLIMNYFDKDLDTFSGPGLGKSAYLFLEKLELNKDQVLYIKKSFDKCYLDYKTMLTFCNFVFSYQKSIPLSEIRRWRKIYENEEKARLKKIQENASIPNTFCGIH